MHKALSAFTDLIVSSPRELVAGGMLFTLVWGFFKAVDGVLTSDTKLGIAIWLLGVNVSKTLGPETFTRVFDRVFGKKHLSWNCFGRSCLASLASYSITLCVLILVGKKGQWNALRGVFVLVLPSVIPDYLSLLKTRWVLGMVGRFKSAILYAIALVLDLCVGVIFALFLPPAFTILALTGLAARFLTTVPENIGSTIVFAGVAIALLNVVASLFTTIWLWLYLSSGFILRGARYLDRYLGWFNDWFDIEHQPLTSMGLVAGALAAATYWALVIVSRVLS